MNNCADSKVIFDTKTLEKIVDDPQWILENEETFWSSYRAQILTRKWASHVNYDIPYEKWRERMQEWSCLSKEERENHEMMKIARRIFKGKDEFLEKALTHDCKFLPEGVDLSVTIQFTAFNPTNAFAMEDLVIDVASKYWKGNPDHIFNLLVHEIFHVGYSFYRTLQSEKEGVEETLYKMLDNIVNEGVCTYVGYRALPLFPVEDEEDYSMLEDDNEVKRLLADTNDILSAYGKVPVEELKKISWDRGVIGRAYYITGAHMCRTIDKERGREALIEVYSKGPISIIGLYNTLAEENMRVMVPVT